MARRGARLNSNLISIVVQVDDLHGLAAESQLPTSQSQTAFPSFVPVSSVSDNTVRLTESRIRTGRIAFVTSSKMVRLTSDIRIEIPTLSSPSTDQNLMSRPFGLL
eukprot:395503-Hanusia_phi.AAC.2